MKSENLRIHGFSDLDRKPIILLSYYLDVLVNP